MTWVVMIIMLLCAALMQTAVPGAAVCGQARMPLLLGVVLYYALQRETAVMFVAALGAGLLQDALSPIPMGYSAFCYCMAGWLASRFRRVVLTEAAVTQGFFGAVASAGMTAALFLLMARKGMMGHPLHRLMARILCSGVLGLLSVPLLFLVIGRLDRVVGNVEDREPPHDLE